MNVTERNDLNNDAIDFLNRNGPVAFEKKFGSHYIVGYNVGAYPKLSATEIANLPCTPSHNPQQTPTTLRVCWDELPKN